MGFLKDFYKRKVLELLKTTSRPQDRARRLAMEIAIAVKCAFRNFQFPHDSLVISVHAIIDWPTLQKWYH